MELIQYIDLFDKRLTLHDITNIDFSLLKEMVDIRQKSKEAEYKEAVREETRRQSEMKNNM